MVLVPVVLWLCCGCRRQFRSWPSWSPPPPPSFGFLFFFFCCFRVRVVAALPLLRRGCAPACLVCLFLRPLGGCVVVVGRFFWLGVFRLGRVVPRSPIGRSGGCCFCCCLAGGLPASVEWVGGFAVVRLSPLLSFFPVGRRVCAHGWAGLPRFCFFLGGGVCLFLPLPSLRWSTHWLANGVANRAAVGVVGGCRPAPAPCAVLFMYTHGLVARFVRLGSGSAGWAVVPAGFVRSLVTGTGSSRGPPPLRCRFGGDVFHFLVAVCAWGAPPARGGVVLTGVWWPLARAWWAGVVLSHGCGRLSFLSGV